MTSISDKALRDLYEIAEELIEEYNDFELFEWLQKQKIALPAKEEAAK